MKRSEAYYTIGRLVKSGIIKQENVKKLNELRTLICSGKDVSSHDGLMLLWAFSHESWFDDDIKLNVTKVVHCCHDGFERCDVGISHAQCSDCPYNDHFSWE